MYCHYSDTTVYKLLDSVGEQAHSTQQHSLAEALALARTLAGLAPLSVVSWPFPREMIGAPSTIAFAGLAEAAVLMQPFRRSPNTRP
jgi:hypothetical protein